MHLYVYISSLIKIGGENMTTSACSKGFLLDLPKKNGFYWVRETKMNLTKHNEMRNREILS